MRFPRTIAAAKQTRHFYVGTWRPKAARRAITPWVLQAGVDFGALIAALFWG